MNIKKFNYYVMVLLDIVMISFVVKIVAIDFGFVSQYSQEDINNFALFGFALGAMAFFNLMMIHKDESKKG